MAKLPLHAKQVFHGVIFDVYQWEQELFDGTHATFEMLKRPNTVQVIPVTAEGIMFLEEEQPSKGRFLGLVGGRQEPGEEPLEAAKRELLEETGLASGEWELLRTYRPLTKIEWEVIVFVARDARPAAAVKLDPGERVTARTVDFDTFVRTVTSEGFGAQELALELLRAERDGKLEEWKEKIYGKR